MLKLDLIWSQNIISQLSHALGGDVEFAILSEQITPSARTHALRDTQNVCAVAKGGTIPNYGLLIVIMTS